MTRYISLLRFTEQGAKTIKNSTARALIFNKLASKAGVQIDGQYWTTGDYGGVLILSADREEKVLRVLAELASQGNVRTTTTQAFTNSEFDAITGK